MTITLLSRAGCSACAVALAQLQPICTEFEVELSVIDIDAAAATDPELRAEYGDLIPVVLIDGAEHGYGEVDVPRLRADLTRRQGA
ncbi:glutaredoxin family protein [Williamsia sp. CHRR-6]|uniref:glutaredoxin family protein n=1 Tax=Williamsia sp. CHRR-6 TaxID=2835871 RepID=UPI001BDA85DB|nr:glutaredoxin family protein [Williamsia sp. CHRR-6]MBT0565982.1 glutaredoxin family protein [Williamsia sp. CHRR-6]